MFLCIEVLPIVATGKLSLNAFPLSPYEDFTYTVNVHIEIEVATRLTHEDRHDGEIVGRNGHSEFLARAVVVSALFKYCVHLVESRLLYLVVALTLGHRVRGGISGSSSRTARKTEVLIACAEVPRLIGVDLTIGIDEVLLILVNDLFLLNLLLSGLVGLLLLLVVDVCL